MKTALLLLATASCAVVALAQDGGQDRLRNIMSTKGDLITTDGYNPLLIKSCPDGQYRVYDSTTANGWSACQYPANGSIHAKGTWSSSTAYVSNDVVTYNSANYIAVAASTNVTPGTDATKWVVFFGGSIGYTAENIANKNQANGYAGLDSSAKLPSNLIPSLNYQAQLGFVPENSANKGLVNGYASLGSDGKVPSSQLPAFSGLGYTAENAANKGQNNGYASLDSSGKVPTGQIPTLSYQTPLGFTPENSANKGQNNGYASLDSSGKVPTGQLPSGLGSGPSAFVVTTTSTVITFGAGTVSTISGAQQTLGSPTITKAGTNTDSGTFFIGVSATGGTLSWICYYGSGINPSNWTQSGVTCTSSSSWPQSTSTRELYTVAVSSGTVGSATRVAPDIEIAQTYCGAGLVLDTNLLGCKIDPAYQWVLVTAPSTSTSTCTSPSIAFDSSYYYVCVATNTWRRVAHSTW